MVDANLRQELTQLEKLASDDPEYALNLISDEHGLSALWQLIVACHYDEDTVHWQRLERSIHSLALAPTAIVIADRLLNKALTVCDFTGESELLTASRRLALLLSPSLGTGD